MGYKQFLPKLISVYAFDLSECLSVFPQFLVIVLRMTCNVCILFSSNVACFLLKMAHVRAIILVQGDTKEFQYTVVNGQ